MPFHLPKSLGKSRQGSPARTRNSTASRNSRLSFAVTPLSDALPGSNDAIFSQAASLTTNRSRSTNAQTPPKRGLNRNHHQRGSPECQQARVRPPSYCRRRTCPGRRSSPGTRSRTRRGLPCPPWPSPARPAGSRSGPSPPGPPSPQAPFKRLEAFLHRLEIMALPHPAHARRRDRVALLAHLVGDPDLAEGGLLQGQRDDSRLDLGRRAVRQQGLAAG